VLNGSDYPFFASTKVFRLLFHSFLGLGSAYNPLYVLKLCLFKNMMCGSCTLYSQVNIGLLLLNFIGFKIKLVYTEHSSSGKELKVV
jgi:hypothetical protein